MPFIPDSRSRSQVKADTLKVRAERTRVIEARISSGKPFSSAELATLYVSLGGNEAKDRLVESIIQRWRKAGLIKIRGRAGRSPLWHLIKEQNHYHSHAA